MVILLSIILLTLPVGFASNAVPVYKSNVSSNFDYLLPDWDLLPFKDIRPLNEEYISWVNSTHGQSWHTHPTILGFPVPPDKCLSYSAATMVDWYTLETGKPLLSYQNFVNNRSENGTNPRELEVPYLNHSRVEPNFDFFGSDPTTGESMPDDIEGFADIIMGDYPLYVNQNDALLGSDYKLKSVPEMYPELNFKADTSVGGILRVFPNYNQVKDLIDKYGIVYARIKTTILGPIPSLEPGGL
ncbi:MAG TPA: hypothetical protein VJK50_00155 [Patescibacteria group bacterium]|nr:hypothetical protein [Patescibacteria group bacterium]